MNERAARNLLLLQAWETQRPATSQWTDEDRAWASRAAAEIEGEHADAGTFLARRAALGVERLLQREPRIRRLLAATTWRPWAGWLIAMAGLLAGAAFDVVGSGRHINILAPPVLALLAWNLAVYAALAIHALMRAGRGDAQPPGPLARVVRVLGLGFRAAAGTTDGGTVPASAAFLRDWAVRSASLTRARVARVLHVAAAAFAAGVLAGLYVRGLALEYRAGWESTFLDARGVSELLGIVLGPAAHLAGIALPDIPHLERLRVAAGPGENAALWIHLYAITIALVVVLPRTLLAVADRWREHVLATRFPVSLDAPYFQRLSRAHLGEAAEVRVLPYGLGVTPGMTLALQAGLQQVFGHDTKLTVAETTAFGMEDELDLRALPAQPVALVVALFALTATPEAENQGAFVARIAQHLAGRSPLVAVVDESAFQARFRHDPARRDERRAAWRRMLAGHACVPVFCELDPDDVSNLESALQDALDASRAT